MPPHIARLTKGGVAQVEVVVHEPVVVLPEELDHPQPNALFLRAERVAYRSAAQRRESVSGAR